MVTFLKTAAILALVFMLACLAAGLAFYLAAPGLPELGAVHRPLAAFFGVGVAAMAVVFALVVTVLALAGAFLAVVFAFLLTGLILVVVALPFLLPLIIALLAICAVVFLAGRSNRSRTA